MFEKLVQLLTQNECLNYLFHWVLSIGKVFPDKFIIFKIIKNHKVSIPTIWYLFMVLKQWEMLQRSCFISE